MKLTPDNGENNIDAVSGATYTSAAVRDAIRDAYQQILEAEGTALPPSAPVLAGEDHRTQLLYAATQNAALTVSAEEGTQVWYTTDGTDPVPGAGSAQKAEGQILIVPTGNLDHTVTVKAVCQRDGQVSGVTETTVTFAAVPAAGSGIQVFEGSALCPGRVGTPYQVLVRVTTLNGVIQKIEDNGTRAGDVRDEVYWNMVYRGDGSGKNISAKLAGMTLETLLSAKTTPNEAGYNTDAVSGATISSDAVKYAAVDALRRAPVSSEEASVMPPQLTPLWGYTVTSNTSYASLYLKAESAQGTVIRYTTDGSEPTLESQTPFGKEISVSYDAKNHPEGQMIPVKCAAFDEKGQKSTVVTTWLVFAAPRTDLPYATGTYTGTAHGVTAQVKVAADYGSAPIVQLITLDEETAAQGGSCLPELLARVYLAQSAQVELVDEGDQGLQQTVLDSIRNALSQAVRAPEPVCTVTPALEKYSDFYGPYEFDAPPSITLTSTAPGAEIYYRISDESQSSSPDVSQWTRYEGAITPIFTKLNGGYVYLDAAVTMDGGKTWSAVRDMVIEYAARRAENAFVVDGQNFSSFAQAAAAVKAGGTIYINENVTLHGAEKMPDVACTIRSAEGKQYQFTSDQPLELRADLTVSHIDWRAETYANGHNFTAGEGVYQNDWWFGSTAIYAGSRTGEATGDSMIHISSGQFEIHGSGGSDTVLNGSTEIHVDGTASVTVNGTAQYARVTGRVSITVEGDAGMLLGLRGRRYSGQIDGGLTVQIIGSPKFPAYGGSFEAVEYSDEIWGTLDLSQAGEGVDASRFTGFATVITP